MSKTTSSALDSDRILGFTAWVSVVLIGTGWQLATRQGAVTSMAPLDLALLRYTIPALLLTPILVRKGFFPRMRNAWTFWAILVGGGLPFGLLGMTGAQLAPAAHMGALLPGTMPLFVTILACFMLNDRPTAGQWVGYAVIAAGVLAITGNVLVTNSINWEIFVGDMLFIGAGILWAVYTVAFRKSGLTPWHGAALVCFWSSIAVVPIWYFSDETRILAAPLTDLLTQMVAQGLLAGVLGLYVYGVAIRHLGASIAGTSGAAVPPLVAIGGIVLLDESVAWFIAIGVFAVSVGIVLAIRKPGRQA